ncbi:MAG: recombinase [Methanomethylophilus alvi]|nr:MAG: recombinase [Methanomethylophilus alvi]
MAFDGRANIVEIDDSDRVVVFDLYRKKKISGTKLGPILGVSDLSTPFKVSLELAGIYPGDPRNKYIDAGNALEPVIRDYVRKNAQSLLPGILGIPPSEQLTVEEPVPREKCGYDHFHDSKVFGGLVDGYIGYGGRRQAVLEIKTSGNRPKWLDSEGKVSVIPETYMLQAGLYAQLSGLDRIVFAVGFLEDQDYDRPGNWVPSLDNCAVIAVDRPDMAKPMEDAEAWYHEYIDRGETPQWTDADADIVKWLKSYDPKAALKARKGNGGSGHRRRF